MILTLIGYWLCVVASGSLITIILNCCTLINVSFLHFGQNSGKFSRIVSLRSFNRVLLLHSGHNTHLFFSIISLLKISELIISET